MGQYLRVRLESLGDLHAAFGRKEEMNIREIVKNLAPNGVVLDIGAHIGGFSLIAAQAVGPAGRVFAFEPVSGNAELLEHNAKINKIDWLIPVRAAVGRNSGSVELLITDTDTMWATMCRSWADVLHHGRASAHVTTHEVPLVTVDGFLREQAIQSVALMKIDVEAAEMDVLAGAADSLAKGRIQQLIVEVHGPTVKWKDVGALLRRYGYEVRDLGGSEMHAVLNSPLTQRAQGRAAVNKPATVALIGCGAVSDVLYAQALDVLASEGLTETVALVDPDSTRTSKIGETLPTARQYRDLSAMLAEITPEIAIIATPHRFHAELAVACMEKGIHVLCEKPMALTTADCDQMIETAVKSGCILAVGHFRRFFPSCEIIKSFLDAGLLGSVRSFRVLEGWTYSWPAQSASFFKRADAGGGVLIDAGAHTMDLLLWWLGDVAEVCYKDDAMGGVEANCQMHLKMASGVNGFVQLSRDWPLPNKYVIECEKGWIVYTSDVADRVEWGLHASNYGLESQLRMKSGANGTKARTLGSGVPEFMDCFVAQLRNVVSAICRREPLRVPGTEARKTVALIERCYRDRKLLNMPWLDKEEVRRAEELANA